MLFEIIIIAIIISVVGYAIKKKKRNKMRWERGGAAYVPDDSKWATNTFQYGRHQSYPIVGNDPDKYFGSLVNESGQHITWSKQPEYKEISENFDYEELVITPYIIYVDGKPDGKMFFHCCDVPNSKNTPKGYRQIDAGEEDSRTTRVEKVSMSFCPYCGIELKIDAKFCPKCGKELV